MNNAPKKVYILENGIYIEITYEQLCQIRSTDEEYKKKKSLEWKVLSVPPKFAVCLCIL